MSGARAGSEPAVDEAVADAAVPGALQRDLRLFYLFRLLATSYLYVPIFMLFQESRGLSFFQRLALGGVYSAVIILVEVPTGVFADRLGRRRSMMVGAAAMVASCAIAFWARSFTWFVLAESLAAMSMALCSGADSAYLFDLLAHHGRAQEYGHRESSASAMHLLGSAIAFAGGGLAAAIDLSLPYVLTAIVAACAVVVAAMLGDDRARHRNDPRTPVVAKLQGWWSDVVGAVVHVKSNRRLAWLVGYSAVVFTLLRATIYVYQPYLDERGFGTVEIGLLFSGMYIAASGIAFRTHRLRTRYGDEPLLWGLLAVLAGSFLLLGRVSTGPWLAVLLAVQALASGIFSPLTKPLLHEQIADSGSRAAVLSVESMARRVALGVFAPLAGLYGQAQIMVLCGVVGLFGMAILAVARLAPREAMPLLPSEPPKG
ncbi:MAG: MFS transporter [Kofleriaceae bacterium]